jgi:hypothetical protein
MSERYKKPGCFLTTAVPVVALMWMSWILL